MPDDDAHVSANADANDETETPQPPPGPADHGGQGGMATRENAPELAHPDGSKGEGPS